MKFQLKDCHGELSRIHPPSPHETIPENVDSFHDSESKEIECFDFKSVLQNTTKCRTKLSQFHCLCSKFKYSLGIVQVFHL